VSITLENSLFTVSNAGEVTADGSPVGGGGSRFVARLLEQITDITGNGDVGYPAFTTEDTDVGGIYNSTTGICTVDATGDWEFNLTMKTSGYLNSHQNAFYGLESSSLGVIMFCQNHGKDITTDADSLLAISGSVTLPLTSGDTVKPYIKVVGETKAVDVDTVSYFAGKFVG